MFAKIEQVTTRKITFAGQSIAQYKKNNIAIKDTKILIGLSITGNPHCVGDNLFAIADHAISIHKETIFLIGDEIHWHNLTNEFVMAEDIPALKEQAVAMGTNYLNENLHVFLNLLKKNIPSFNIQSFQNSHLSIDDKIKAINAFGLFHIVRWHDWVSSDTHKYLEKQAEIEDCYETDPTLKNDLERSVNDFIQRKNSKHTSEITDVTNSELLKLRARGYIKEESPALFWIPAALKIDFVAYPGKITKVFESTRDFFITDNHSEAPHPLSIGAENSHKMANWLRISIKMKNQKVSSLDSVRFFSSTPRRPIKSLSSNDVPNSTTTSSLNATTIPIRFREDIHTPLISGSDCSNIEPQSKSPPSVADLLESIQSWPNYQQRRYLESLNREVSDALAVLTASRDTRTPVPFRKSSTDESERVIDPFFPS